VVDSFTLGVVGLSVDLLQLEEFKNPNHSEARVFK